MVTNEHAMMAVAIASKLENYGQVSSLLDNAQEIYEWLELGADAALVNTHEEA